MNPTTSETTETKASAAEHERKMAELGTVTEPWPGDALARLRSTLAYCNDLAADRDRLAERNGFLEAERDALRLLLEHAKKELEQERAKLQAAERLLATVRTLAEEGAALPYYDNKTKADAGQAWGDRLETIVETIDRAIKQNGSRAGGAGGKP